MGRVTGEEVTLENAANSYIKRSYGFSTKSEYGETVIVNKNEVHVEFLTRLEDRDSFVIALENLLANFNRKIAEVPKKPEKSDSHPVPTPPTGGKLEQ